MTRRRPVSGRSPGAPGSRLSHPPRPSPPDRRRPGRPQRAARPRHASNVSGVGYEMLLAEQTLAPAMAQIWLAVSKPSLTTVDSILEAVTQDAASSDAGSVVLVSAGSMVVPFIRELGGVSPASRMVARAAASWASL